MILSVNSTVGIAFDVVIVAILAIFGLIGLKKGFFKSVLSLFSTLAVLIISVLCAGHLAKLINKIYNFTGLIAGKLSGAISSMGSFYSQTIPQGVSGKDLVNNIPSSTNGFLKKLMAHVLNPLSASDVEGLTVSEIVSGAFASIIMLIISAILLFIAIKIIIAISSRLFDNITRNRVFGATNKLLGLGFGVVKGGLIILIFTFVLTLLTVIPAVNTKLSPIIQDNTKLARPIYNYTDEFVEKHVVDGKIVQKWIDNLWENKYKGRGDDSAEEVVPNGSVERPYVITLTDTASVYTATININFMMSDTLYYSIDATTIDHEPFALTCDVTGAEFSVYASDDLTTPLDISSLINDKTYIIKFTKTGADTQVTANLKCV